MKKVIIRDSTCEPGAFEPFEIPTKTISNITIAQINQIHEMKPNIKWKTSFQFENYGFLDSNF